MDQDTQLLYTVRQCCRLLAIGRTKFYELIASGQIPIRKVGRKTLVAASDLKRWIEHLPAVEASATPPKSQDLDGSDLAEAASPALGGNPGRQFIKTMPRTRGAKVVRR
jgi:excisionase family DNA binding protein